VSAVSHTASSPLLPSSSAAPDRPQCYEIKWAVLVTTKSLAEAPGELAGVCPRGSRPSGHILAQMIAHFELPRVDPLITEPPKMERPDHRVMGRKGRIEASHLGYLASSLCGGPSSSCPSWVRRRLEYSWRLLACLLVQREAILLGP